MLWLLEAMRTPLATFTVPPEKFAVATFSLPSVPDVLEIVIKRWPDKLLVTIDPPVILNVPLRTLMPLLLPAPAIKLIVRRDA